MKMKLNEVNRGAGSEERGKRGEERDTRVESEVCRGRTAEGGVEDYTERGKEVAGKGWTGGRKSARQNRRCWGIRRIEMQV